MDHDLIYCSSTWLLYCALEIFVLLICPFVYQGNKMPQDTQSARGKRIAPVRGVGNKTEYSEQLTSLLASNDFRDRIRGIDQLVADCQHNPNMVISTIFPVSPSFISALFFVVLNEYTSD